MRKQCSACIGRATEKDMYTNAAGNLYLYRILYDMALCDKNDDDDGAVSEPPRKRQRVVSFDVARVFEEETSGTREWLRCRKCGSTTVSWTQAQTRSSDEAMTVFCTCSCGARWKF